MAWTRELKHVSHNGKWKLVWGYQCLCGGQAVHLSHWMYFPTREDAEEFAGWYKTDHPDFANYTIKNVDFR